MKVRPALATLVVAALVAIIGGGCGGPILANEPAPRPNPPAPVATPVPPADPQPLAFPRADGPHDRLTEWWYYTGHLRAQDGRRFGFELVVFRAERGAFPVTWASHVALTDEAGGRFAFAQRAEVGPQVDRSPRRGADGSPAGLSLAISGADPADPATLGRAAWSMTGGGGSDTLIALASAAEAVAAGVPGGLGIELRLADAMPPVLHDGIGWIDFGPAGSSYYYSRPRMAATGSVRFDGEQLAVEGTAWFDHQWGDFIAVGAGGWDWFAVNLADGTDVTISRVRAADGTYPLAYGTLRAPDGAVRHLPAEALAVEATAAWTSPRTGATYPAAWTIRVPSERLEIRLYPTVADQELDTRATTGVVYWEGSQVVKATLAGRPLDGDAYVELTGYVP